ncbi:fimbria/pilus outer membrane usher protein [Bdellovibrio sp. HCB-162]|uniref:fimbria/pilus outer membrane usher protein n=1 Tax=Bdellovibrio sp. HCB-162 TaxID=3394234 RepID=UPI0039BD0DE1
MRYCLSLVLVLLLPFISAFAEGPRPALAKPYLVAPLLLDGALLGEAWIFPRDEKKNFSVEARPLLEGLRPTLKEDLFKNLEKRVRPEGVLSLYDLESSGLSVQFDENSLEMRLDLPLKYRRGSDLNLNYMEGTEQSFLRPTAQSGYLNFRAQQSYQYGNAVEDQKLPIAGHVDFVENVHGVVLESMADYLEHANHPWKRQDTRLRYDDEESMIRYTLGDLTLGSRGFQVSPNIAGLSVVKEFSIQPYKTLRPLSNTEIVIKRPSLVEIYVNGFLFSQIRLAPGIFNIRDFPLASGQNNVKVKIRDDLGQEETFDFSVLFENTLLGKGVHEFSYAIGLPWTESGADRAYDNKAALGTVFHRMGLNDQVTFGLNYQNYLSQALTGIEFSGIANWGYLSVEGAYSTQSPQLEGYAERLRYRSLDRMFGQDVPLVLTLEAENRDKQFSPVSVMNLGMINYLRRYDGQLNFRFGGASVFGVGAGSLEMPLGENQRVYRVNFITPLNLQTRLELSYNKTVAATDDERFFVSIYWNESQGKYSASAYYDSLQKSSNVAINRNNLYKYGDFRATASVSNTEQSTSGNLSAEYLAQPYSVRLEHYTLHQNGEDTNTTSLGLNTGFAWVGSRGAFTQPINDSFVLLYSENLPPGQELVINPRGVHGDAQLGPRHTTVLGDQSAYYKNTVNVDSTSLPVGYLLGKEYFGTQSTYRSGILIDLNLKKKVMVKGRMKNSKGEVLAYFAGDVVNSQGQLVDNNFFTNKNGGFLIEGLEPGEYKIMTDHPEYSPITFKVLEAAANQQDLGEVIVKEEGNP